jgi:hypothetical protein
MRTLYIGSKMKTPILATEWVNGGRQLSRRGFICSLVAAAPVVLVLRSSHAQDNVWREYRRPDLGFRIEMPGAPKLETEEDDQMRATDARIDYESITLGVTWQDFKGSQSDETLSARFREGMRLAGMPVTSETSLVMDGFPARKFIREADGMNYVQLYVVMGTQTIAASAVGGHGIHSSPIVRRFFDSFRLLRRAR